MHGDFINALMQALLGSALGTAHFPIANSATALLEVRREAAHAQHTTRTPPCSPQLGWHPICSGVLPVVFDEVVRQVRPPPDGDGASAGTTVRWFGRVGHLGNTKEAAATMLVVDG